MGMCASSTRKGERRAGGWAVESGAARGPRAAAPLATVLRLGWLSTAHNSTAGELPCHLSRPRSRPSVLDSPSGVALVAEPPATLHLGTLRLSRDVAFRLQLQGRPPRLASGPPPRRRPPYSAPPPCPGCGRGRPQSRTSSSAQWPAPAGRGGGWRVAAAGCQLTAVCGCLGGAASKQWAGQRVHRSQRCRAGAPVSRDCPLCSL